MAPGMMCFGKKPVDLESKKNEDIEKQLRVDRKRQEREVKLLLLGRPQALNRESELRGLTSICRRWRKWKVDRAQADARYPRRRLLEK